jgi:hypothetical protein
LLNLASLEWQCKDLSHLELPFTEQDLKKVVMEAPKEKAPNQDGFIGLFFSHCWDIIKEYLLRATNQFYCLNQQGMQFLNQAYVVLIPKKDTPRLVSKFRPINLIHSFTKLISKLLASRLAPELEDLISINQTTFIKKCCIHDNFMYVQEVIKDLHKRKFPSLFIKLDIDKAFDTVNWSYLLNVMEQLGFSQR